MAVTQITDSPSKNFATISPADKFSSVALDSGNLSYTAAATWTAGGITQAPTQKTYWEFRPTSDALQVGVHNNPSAAKSTTNRFYEGTGTIAWQDDSYWNVGNNLTGKTGWSSGDVCALAFDPATGKTWFAVNNTWNDSGDPANGTNASLTLAEGAATGYGFFAAGQSGNMVLNFGQDDTFGGTETSQGNTDGNGNGSFYYTPPSGFFALMATDNPTLTIENPDDHFKELIVDHDGSSTNFTIPWSTYNGSSGTYDTLFEIKRLADEKWFVIDTIRGLGQYFSWNATTAKTDDTNVLSVSGTTGTLGSTLADDDYLVRMHRLGIQASRDTTNSEGSITGGSNSLIISANATAGWSLCTYTGTGSNGTFGHGLSVAPEFIRFFNTANADGITVYHASNSSTAAEHYGNFDSAPTTLTNDDSTKFNDTAPTADVNSVGTANSTNKATDAMWCFSMHSVSGFNKIGSFTGNGNADGPVAELGLSPKSVILKNANGSATGDDWYLVTDTRFLYNGDSSTLAFNLTATEQATNLFDMLSNGIKLRTTNAGVNENTNTIVYQIIGSPFAGSTPNTAR